MMYVINDVEIDCNITLPFWRFDLVKIPIVLARSNFPSALEFPHPWSLQFIFVSVHRHMYRSTNNGNRKFHFGHCFNNAKSQLLSTYSWAKKICKVKKTKRKWSSTHSFTIQNGTHVRHNRREIHFVQCAVRTDKHTFVANPWYVRKF